MDKIIIKDLEIFARHGVMREEKTLGQKFLVSMYLCLDLKQASKTGSLNDTVNYGLLCHEVTSLLTENTFDLIEEAAEAVGDHILLKYESVKKVTVEVKKPWAPIGLPLSYASVEITRSRHQAYIALGSNLGDREKEIRTALDKLASNKYCMVKKISSLYETEPVGYTDQGKFINAAAMVETMYSPRELMSFLLSVEEEQKRQRDIRFGPRTIDLDILLYDNIVSQDELVAVPHPRMSERLFVLEPLCEIAPYVIHPLLNKTIEELKNIQALYQAKGE